MANTLISDVIVPSIFLPYVVQRTVERSEIIQSGIVVLDPTLSQKVTDGGRLIDMPYWEDLDGDDEVISDSAALTVNKITTAQDKARKHQRGKAFGANDLAGMLAGDDPMQVIASLIADYRIRKNQAQLISTLKGVFNAPSMSANLADIHQTSGAANSSNMLTAETWINAMQLMGDQKEKLAACIMHSATESHLRKLDLIDFVQDSEQGKPIAMFQGKRVIIDDTTDTQTVDSKTVYSTYLFGQGAIGMGISGEDAPIEGGHGTWQLEFGRTPLSGNSQLINRWRNILHPRGVAWQEDTVAAESPTNAEIELADNWTRVYDQKNVRIVKITHNIAA